MSSKRHYWSKMNHDEARHSIELMDDAEAGRWFRGWLVGAGGSTPSDEAIQAKPIEWRTGYGSGRASFADAQEYSQKQAERVSKRYTKATTVDSGSDPVDKTHTGSLPDLPITVQRTTNNDKENKVRDYFVPPTMEDLSAYAKEVGLADPQRWMDHYVSNGWKVGKTKMVDWKACVRNWARNSNQPKPQAQKPEWVIRRLEELNAKHATAERQYRRDCNERGADSQTAKLSRIEMDRIKKEIDSL